MNCTCGPHWLVNDSGEAVYVRRDQDCFHTSNGACCVVCLNCGTIYGFKHDNETNKRLVWKVDLFEQWNGL